MGSNISCPASILNTCSWPRHLCDVDWMHKDGMILVLFMCCKQFRDIFISWRWNRTMNRHPMGHLFSPCPGLCTRYLIQHQRCHSCVKTYQQLHTLCRKHHCYMYVHRAHMHIDIQSLFIRCHSWLSMFFWVKTIKNNLIKIYKLLLLLKNIHNMYAPVSSHSPKTCTLC